MTFKQFDDTTTVSLIKATSEVLGEPKAEHFVKCKKIVVPGFADCIKRVPGARDEYCLGRYHCNCYNGELGQ